MSLSSQMRVAQHITYSINPLGVQGTALSAEEEFFEVYGLHVLQIPTHKPSRRTDHAPRVYYT